MKASKLTEDRDRDGAPRFGPPTRANPLWRVVIVTGALFSMSCLLWITAGFGNPAAPGNRWLNRNGIFLVAVSGAVSVIAAVGAMLVDSIQTRRMQQRHPEADACQTGPASSRFAMELAYRDSEEPPQ